MIEHEKMPASGTAKTALGLSIGALGAELLTGGLNGLVGGWGNGMPACGGNANVNRYELGLIQENAAKDNEIALLKADKYTDQKFADLNDRYNARFTNIEAQLAAQAVHNQKVEGSFALAQADLAATKKELYCAIANEAEKRCCGDNAIVTYANATFYQKMVADVTTGTTTTAQTVYNPIPNCGCGCK